MTWKNEPLKDVGTWYGGGTPSKFNIDFWEGGTVPWLSPKDMGPEVLKTTLNHITRAAVESSSVKVVPEGSVALVVRSGIIERTIPVALVPFATTLNQDMKAVATRSDIDPRWIAWGLRAFERQLLRDTRKAGTTVASIEWPRFQAFEIPVPPLSEQRCVVDLLEDHLSRLDAADQEVERTVDRLDGMWLSALSATRGLFSDSTTARIGDVATTSLGKMLDAKKQRGELVPYLRNVNVRWGSFDVADLQLTALSPDEISKFDVRDGDVMVCEGGEPGRCGVWHGHASGVAFQKALHRVRVRNQEELLPEFLALMLEDGIRSGRLDQLFTGTTIKHLPQEKLRTIEIVVPTIESQREALRRMAKTAAARDRLRMSLSVAAQHSQALRRSLLDAAFSGRLTGSSSDLSEVEEMMRAQPTKGGDER